MADVLTGRLRYRIADVSRGIVEYPDPDMIGRGPGDVWMRRLLGSGVVIERALADGTPAWFITDEGRAWALTATVAQARAYRKRLSRNRRKA